MTNNYLKVQWGKSIRTQTELFFFDETSATDQKRALDAARLCALARKGAHLRVWRRPAFGPVSGLVEVADCASKPPNWYYRAA